MAAQNSGKNSGRFQKGNPHRIPKGTTLNPGGRPKKKPITDAYEKLAAMPFPGDAKGRTFAQILAEAQYREAIKGHTQAAREITDRLEGKAMQSVELTGPDGAPVEVNVNHVRSKLLESLLG